MKQAQFDAFLANSKIADNIEVSPPTLTVFPRFNPDSRAATFAAAYVFNVTETVAGERNTHNAIVSYHLQDDEADLMVWCGDNFLQGKSLSEAEARSRCEEALAPVPSTRTAALMKEMLALFKSHGDAAACRFWAQWRKNDELCVHTTAVLAHLRDNVPNFQQTLVNLYDSAMDGTASADFMGELMSLPELAFKVPVLFVGDRGAGKTIQAREFARSSGANIIEVAGHEGIEAVELLGYLVPYGKDYVWKDGRISQAVRSAQTRPTVLIIDELLRIPQRELSLLLSLLSPDRGMYRLPTGRILDVTDGVATEETLECPVKNLCVVATTNIGSEYAVDELDPAVAERFVPLQMDSTPATLKVILAAVAAANGLPVSSAKACLKFFEKMSAARNCGLMHRAPTTRTLVRALELANGMATAVQRGLQTQHLLWVGRTADGQPIPEQMKTVKTLLAESFKSK